MPKLNRREVNSGSLRKADGRYRAASADWSAKDGGFIIRGMNGKRVAGPYTAMHEAKAEGIVFHADGGRRAQQYA